MVYRCNKIFLSSDIFSLSVHPTKPLYAAGLLSGRLEVYGWGDGSEESGEPKGVMVDYGGKCAMQWGTRRYRESCRAVAFTTGGEYIFSAGVNSLLKLADVGTGQVVSKAYIPSLKNLTDEYPSVITPLSSVHLLVGTDSGRIHLYDVRENSLTRPAQTWKKVHDDYISSITPLPPYGGGLPRQFASTGASTLAYIDFRKQGKAVIRSEDQEDEQLCSAYVSGLPARAGRRGGRVLVGSSSGVVALWNRDEWEDQRDRINFSKPSGESVDAVVALPDTFQHRNSEFGRFVAAGSADGKVRIAKLGSNRIVETLQHSLTIEKVKGTSATPSLSNGDESVDGVTELGIDCEGNLVSAAGSTIKVWYWDENTPDVQRPGKKGKRSPNETDTDTDLEDGFGDNEQQFPKKRRKKRKGGTGKAKSAGPQKLANFRGLD
ncbi:WD40-repeat-containing domain protein [Tuber indicum]|nr:WD40-repeat-containing domain protein [Tuber indicum]